MSYNKRVFCVASLHGHNVTFMAFLFFSVPTAAPYYVEYWAKNASAIFIEISPIYNLYDENGVISHYRISLEEFNSYEAAPTSPTSQFFHSAYLERSSPVSFLKTRGNFTNVAVKCSSSFREVLGKTSQQMQVTIANLRYYTRYRVRASACTVVGCGPWSVSYGLIRTEEFHPTCPPANVHIEVKSSTSLEINWNHLEKSCTHGILTQYQLLVGEAGSFTHPTGMAAWPIFDESTYHERFRVVLLKDDISYFGSSAFLKKELHGLKKFFTYCVQINGFTVVGGGPKSKPTCGRTLQDCKYYLNSIAILKISCAHASAHEHRYTQTYKTKAHQTNIHRHFPTYHIVAFCNRVL